MLQAASLGFGTAMSQILAGEIAETSGYAAMFITLSAIAGVAWFCVYLMKETGSFRTVM